MPIDPAQVQADANFITSQPGWADAEKRRDFIREVAIDTRSQVEPDLHAAVISELWKRADDRGLIKKGADFAVTATEEVVKSAPASAGAVMFAANDLVQGTPFQSGHEVPDTGSKTRLKRGVANLWDATGQRLKQIMPGESNQAERDSTLEALKADIDNNLHPKGLESWLAGEFDDGFKKPDPETQEWLDLLSGGMARKAVAADYMGQVDPEKVRAWMETDRNPLRADSDIPGEPGPREFLADYLATRDPISWAAFMSRVTETDTQHTTRLRRWIAEANSRKVLESMPDGLAKEMATRSMEMQTSPIDMATAIIPILRGGKALQAAKAGGFMAAGGRVITGGLIEAGQEGLTSYLDDPRNKAGTVLEAAALGAVGNTVIEGTMATGGAAIHRLTRPSPTSNPNATPVQPQTAPAANPNSMAAIAERGGAQPVTWSPTTRQPILTDVPDGPPTITVPESQATLQEQLARTAEGLKPATFIPEQSSGQVTVPEGLVSTPVTSPEPGVMVHRPDMDPATVEQASQEAPGELMGMGVPTKPADADRVIVLRRADGTPVLDVASNAETKTQVREALGKMAKEGDTITIEAPEGIIQERQGRERTAPRVGEIVTHEGYTGRLVQDGARFAVQVPNGPTIEVPSLTGLTRNTDLKTAQAIGLAELQQQSQTVEVKEASFQAAPDGSLTIQDGAGNTFVPHNPQLLRSVRPGPNGLEVLVRNPKQPGRIIKLTGAQAQNAQEAFLKAAETVEANGGKVNWGTTPKPRFQFSQGNNSQSDGLAEFRRALDILLEGDKKSQTDPDLKSKWALWDLWSYLVQGPKTQKSNAPHLTAFWSKMASFTDAFQYGKTQSQNMTDIARALSLPGKPITMEDHGSFIRITGVNGSLDIKAARTARPYISSLEAGSSGKEGGGGTQLYQAALDWIHNNGKRLRSDPAGITPINAIRRTSNMLSSALRWGTTKHLGHNRFQDLSWSPKSDAWNIANMATTEMWHAFKALENARNWRYDFASDQFLDNDTGKPISPDELRSTVVLGSPDRTGIGFSTLQRAILTASALEGFQRGKPADTLLEVETRRRAGSGLKRFLYSQGGTLSQSLKGGVKALQKAANEAVRILNSHLPGLVSEKVSIFNTVQEFLESGHLDPAKLSPEEVAQIQSAEGFLDNLTGHTIVIAENVQIRPGETPRSAIARVIIHERIGHDGINTLLATDPEFAKRWNDLSAQIPQADLDAIATQEGYQNIAGDRAQLALEWFARQTEVNLDAPLVKRMWKALTDWLRKAYAGFPKRTAFETELQDLITDARNAAVNNTSDPTTPEALANRFQYSLGGTRILHPQGQPYRVNDRATRAMLTGTALPRSFTQTVANTERERRALDQAAAQLGNDLKAAVESHAARTGRPETEVYELVNQALSGAPGTNAVLMQADPVLHTRALRARTFLDDLSQAIAQTLPVGNLHNTIVLNQGAWMKRSYAAFDPASGWHYDTVMQAARDGKDIAGKPARQIVANAMRYLRQQTPQATRAEIEADMRDLMDRDSWTGYLTGRAAIRKNVSSLMERQSLPVEIRALMGEEHNPVKRFVQSASFQSQFLHRHQQQTSLRTIGLANGLFNTQRGGVYTQQIPADNPRWSPLAGIWTTPQLWEAMQEMQGLPTGEGLWANVGEALRVLGNEAKLNRVAMNPDSWLVNALGNVAALIQTGDVFSTNLFSRFAQALSLYRSDRAKSGAVVNATAEVLKDAQRQLLARLTASGVIGETLTLRDVEASLPRHVLQWVAENETRERLLGAAKGALWGQGAGRGFGLTGRAIGGTAGAALGMMSGLQNLQKWQETVANFVMTGPDALGKITGYLGNYETALRAGMTPDAAYTWASERTRNTFPDYGKLPEILRSLSRYGFAASFIGFQFEVYRNTIWNLRYAAQDLRSGNAALVTSGIKRTLGAAAIGTLAAGGLQAIFQGLAGTDDERNKKWRKWFAAPWERNGVIVFTNYDDKGVSYFNTSYLVPQATITELVNAAASGTDPVDAAGNIVAHVWQQFMGGSVHLDPLIDAYKNVDKMGRPVTYKTGIPGAAERVDSAVKTILEPGWAAKMERLSLALREAERRGRTFSVEEEIKRFVGIREFTRTWPDMVKRGFDALAAQNTAIRGQANKILGENNPGSRIQAVQDANQAIEALAQELQTYEADLRALGVPEHIIKQARKDSAVPKRFSSVMLDSATGDRIKSAK